jgi:DNA-binding NarL/FixJ family response regulator
MSEELRRIRILTADDHPLFREGVTGFLSLQPDMEVIGEAESGEQAVAMYREHQPDIVLMDLQMPGMGGIAAIRAIVKDFPEARIIVLTTYEGDVQATRALRAGAAGYLIKSTLRKDVVTTVRQVHEGRKCVCGVTNRAIRAHMADESLSSREVEVLVHVASGFSNKSIANHMGLSIETVKTHMKSILAKVNAKDRTEAVVTALRRGIIDG